MKKLSRLNVYVNAELLGHLTKYKNGAIEFQYHMSWIEKYPSLGISRSLPVREGVYRGDLVFNYFDNLLPDAKALREKIAAKAKAKSLAVFDLMEVLGRDCIGALQLLPADKEAPKMKKIEGESLSEGQIAELLKGLFMNPLGVGEDQDFRLSLAGQQEKTALLFHQGKWMKPIGSCPTSHILKPVIGKLKNGWDLSDSVENEFLCMKLMSFYGLSAADVEIVRFEDSKALSVKRFDRREIDGKLYRLPQEDMCQALSYPSHLKYQSDGGPGIEMIFRLLDESNHRERDQYDFMKSQVLFYLLAAIDGHAKNYSLSLKAAGLELSPFYDVLSASALIDKKMLSIHKAKLAMSVGGKARYKIKDIFKRHWQETAKKINFPQDQLENIFEELIVSTLSLENYLEGFSDEIQNDKLLESILLGVQSRLQNLL